MRTVVVVCFSLLAANVLAGTKSAELIETLRSSDSVKLRANAARLLGKYGTTEALDALLQAASDPHPVVRAAVCASLVGYIDKRVRPALSKAQEDQDPGVRKAASAALKQLAAERSVTTAATGDSPGLALAEIRATSGSDEQHQLLRNAIDKYVHANKPRFAISSEVTRGYSLGGGLACEDRHRGTQSTIYCKVNLVISRQPGKVVLGSVGAQAEAAIGDPKKPESRRATQAALLQALAKSLVEDMVSVVNEDRIQNGEEEL